MRLYGQPYPYTGSRSNSTDPIPQELSSIIDRLSSELHLENKPNSVLINHFPGSSRIDNKESYLAMHSDDEPSIVAESKILTISIGSSRKIVFEEKHNDSAAPVELNVHHNSLYTMSRSSQNWYRHGVPSPPTGQDIEERFSITFRCLRKQSPRSIVLIGDSNTKDINFGTGSGKVGESFPGKRVKASKVSNIDPSQCIGYTDAFIMCGTNDLRCENVRHESDISHVVDELRKKICAIKQLCPTIKVFVIPVMPSRIPQMNVNIRLYNELVNHMLYECYPDVWFQGIYSFLDLHGKLSERLCRPNDKIHLGPKGIAKLVTYIKVCVFQREKRDIFMKGNNIKSPSQTQESTQEVGSPDPT